jgi:hypothetical protein
VKSLHSAAFSARITECLTPHTLPVRALGDTAFSAGEGLVVRLHESGWLLIESEDGVYRLFEPPLADSSFLRLFRNAHFPKLQYIFIVVKAH